MVEPKLEGFDKKIENVFNIEKYIATKPIKHIYSNRNGLLKMLMMTLKYNEKLYSLHVKYNILLILHNKSCWNKK